MSDDDILTDAKELFELAAERELENRRDALDDLRFGKLDEQWPEKVRQDRLKAGRPCWTYNKLDPATRQVLNDARQNRPAIKVHPADSTADPKTAEVYNGLIRNIEVTSRADAAYDTALDFAVSMGFGYFRINTEYAQDDTFDLDLMVKRIANPFSVYGDPHSTESDSSDWNCCFVTELLERKLFQKKYKGAEEVDWEELGYDKLQDPWREDDRVLVAEYFSRDEVPKTILLLSDQSVVDEEVYEKQKDTYDQSGITVVTERQTRGHKVTQRIMSGAEVLETNKWAGKFIPIIPVYGREVNVGGRRYFRSLIRSAKDAQRNFNFWRTATSELVALAPKAPYIGPKGAFNTDAAKWATANVENHSHIEYDGETAPQRQPFAGVPAGALQEAMNASDDIKAITGIFDASLGAPSNETSGRAIMARQREGDVSTFDFIDNLSRAIEHGGRILIDLIPLVYTGSRIVRVLGPEGAATAQNVPLGQPVQIQQPDGTVLSHVFDLSRGKYDLTVETGPSFSTRREESANQMMEFLRIFPEAAPYIGDILAGNLDWPGADIIKQRLQALLPAALQGGGGAGQPPNNQAAAAAPAQPDPQKNANDQEKIALQAAQQQQQGQLDARRVEIELYRAQTERMRLVHEINQANSGMAGNAGQ